MRIFSKIWVYVLFFLLLSYPIAKTLETHKRVLPAFGLLVPSGAEHALGTRIWLQAASEVGVPLETITEEDFIDPFQTDEIESKAVLIPDEVAQNASSTLISYLQKYVSLGGKLILVGDALMHELNGRLKESFPTEVFFGFPKIVGRVGDTIQYNRDPIRITDDWKTKLQIPPGQTTPDDSVRAAFREFSTYQSLHARYPHYETDHEPFSGTRILEGADGSLVAGIKKIDQGEVLWINLPLSFLKRRTDGLLMHSFLRWISEDWLGFPKLLAVPNGIGGMILNVHVDSNAALPYLDKMKREGFFSEGPFSIHVTAGPDTREPGDGLGFNLEKNPVSQRWVKEWIKDGHEVGSHGGWIHDYFGLNLSDKKTDEFVNYLQKNFDSIKKFTGKAPVEYSAPLGNQPIWVNSWLRDHGYKSYYFVGDNGMPPTQNFRDTQFTDNGLWSFPIAAYLQVASFEEADEEKIPKELITGWLNNLSHFVADTQTTRLFYFHPPGIQFYDSSLKSWRKTNRALKDEHRFQWYTMNGLSTFLSERRDVKWKVVHTSDEHQFELQAQGCDNLTQMVWRIPKASAKALKVVLGSVEIREVGERFEIQSKGNHTFSVRYEEIPHAI